MKNFLDSLAKLPNMFLNVLINAATYVILCAVAGVSLVTIGVNHLYGDGVSFIVLGALLLAFMVLIARGVRG